jgi:Bax protein
MKTDWKSANPPITYCLILLLVFLPALFLTRTEIIEPPIKIPIEIAPEPMIMPDFGSILDVDLKKQEFFDFVEPYIDEVNAQIMQQRNRIQEIRDRVVAGEAVSASDLRYLSTMAEQYEMEADDFTSMEFLNVLLRRVDKIPASLALAQAANESAWGTSRFAQDGNNFFGQWCYSDGCGIVPNRRRQGAIHEVKSFDSVRESVQAYIHNLNTFPSYQMLRRIRQQLRQQNRPLDGVSLADGLESYSSRGLDYIEEVQNLIYSNNLLARDNHAL